VRNAKNNQIKRSGFVKCQGFPCYVHIHTYKDFNCSFDLTKVMSLLHHIWEHGIHWVLDKR